MRPRPGRGGCRQRPPGGLNLVDVRDVAAGHLLAAERGQTGRRYILGNENLTQRVPAPAGRRRRTSAAAVVDHAALGCCSPSPPSPSCTAAPPAASRTRRSPRHLSSYHWFYRSDRAPRLFRPLHETLHDALRHSYDRGQTLRPRGLNGWLLGSSSRRAA
ncbi:MAG: hypothetical protein U0736_12835 [Gemmataceae bacterium]